MTELRVAETDRQIEEMTRTDDPSIDTAGALTVTHVNGRTVKALWSTGTEVADKLGDGRVTIIPRDEPKSVWLADVYDAPGSTYPATTPDGTFWRDAERVYVDWR